MSATTRVRARAALGPARPVAEPVVLAVPRPAEAAALDGALRRVGCEVFRVSTACEARRLVRMGEVTTAVLATELQDESGWLTCAKLQLTDSAVRVVLYGAESPRLRRLAAFVGAAALLSDADAVAAWLRPFVKRRVGAC